MAKIRKYALGGVAGVSAPAQGTTGETTAPAATTQGGTMPTGSLFNTLSNMTPMSSNQVAASNQMADQMRTRAAPMPAPYAGLGTAIPSLPNFGPQGGPMGRPGMGGQFGPMGGPMGRFGGRFGGPFGPMGRGNQFGPGMPTGRGGGINPTPSPSNSVTYDPKSGQPIVNGSVMPLEGLHSIMGSNGQFIQGMFLDNSGNVVNSKGVQQDIDQDTLRRQNGMLTPVSQPSVTPKPVNQPQVPTTTSTGVFNDGKGNLWNDVMYPDDVTVDKPNKYGMQPDVTTAAGAYKKGGAVKAFKKGGSIKSMDSKPSKNYTTDGGRLNLGSGRVSTAQKNKKSPSW